MSAKHRSSAIAIICLLVTVPSLSADSKNSYNQEVASYEANQKGVQLMERGKVKEALIHLEKAHSLNPRNGTISENLAVAYNNYSIELMDDKRFLEAREYLEKAVKLDPKNISARNNLEVAYKEMGKINGKTEREIPQRSFETNENMDTVAHDFLVQGIEYYDRKEYELAKEVLQESINFSKVNPTAFELLGDIAYMEQDLKKAKEHYTQAFRQRRSKSLEEKIGKVEREAPVENKMAVYSDEHFIIRYKNEKNAAVGGGFEIREYLRQAYRTISQEMGFYPKEKVPVILYSEDEYRELSNMPAWTGAHFDGKIRIPLYEKKVAPRDFQKLILHELTHSFVLSLGNGRCPEWLNEGLAQYQENKARPINLTFFNAALRTQALLSMDDLEGGIQEGAETQWVYLFYQQSYVLTKYLVEKHKMFKIKQMLTAYGKGNKSQQVFKDNLGVSLKAFEIKWLASLSGGKK